MKHPFRKAPDHMKAITAVAEAWGLSADIILGKARSFDVTSARHTAIFVVRETCKMKSTDLSSVFGRDHTSISYALRRVEEKIRQDADYAEGVKSIIKSLGEAE